MISTRSVKYQLAFCRPHNYAAFVRAVRGKTSIARVGYIGVECFRLFVSVWRGKLKLEIYHKAGNSWEPYSKSVKLQEPDIQKMMHSAQEYEEELAKVFFRAFPKAEESYFDNIPDYKDVLAMLHHTPTGERMDELMLMYTCDEDETIDDADGLVSIICGDGILCVPYDNNAGSRVLQLYRAKFHPDARVVSTFNGVFDWLEDMWSRVSSVTLGSVLNRIDSIVK